MARLPQPGGDQGNWGDILNNYLSQSLTSDGRLQDGVVGSDQIQDGAVTKATVGLGNVDDTSDLNKPVSMAAQAILDSKGDLTGPSGATSGMLASFDGTTGKLLKDSGLYVSADSKLGIGTTVPAADIDIVTSRTYPTGITNTVSITATGDSSSIDSQPRALSFIMTATGAVDFKTGTAATFEVIHSATADMGAQVGTSLNLRLYSSGNSSKVYGHRVITTITNTGSITTYRAYESRSPNISGTGTISSAYGLYLEPLSGSNVNAGYGVYQTGTNDLNYFNGKVGIGTNTPLYQLQIEGDTALASMYRFHNSNTNSPGFLFKRARGTKASPLNISPGNWLGKLQFQGLVNAEETDFAVLGFVATNTTAKIGYLNFTNSNPTISLMRLTTDGNLALGDFDPIEKLVVDGNMRLTGFQYIADQVAPATPTAGGVLYVESGSLKYKGSSGTVTVLGAA
jgi:hypothetical protein